MTLRIDDFEWLDLIIEKIRSKHGVEPEDAESVLRNIDSPPYVRRVADEKYLALGRTEDGGDYLVVVFAMPKPHVARVISARTMDSAERSEYRRRAKGKLSQ